MQPTEAIGILRGTTSPSSVLHPQIAADLGAQALEAWAWVERTKTGVRRTNGVWYCLHYSGPTPLAAVLDAMEKERKEKV